MTHPQQNTERHERILKLLAAGITPSDVARLEGISRQRVYQIIAVHKSLVIFENSKPVLVECIRRQCVPLLELPND